MITYIQDIPTQCVGGVYQKDFGPVLDLAAESNSQELHNASARAQLVCGKGVKFRKKT